MTHTEKPIVDPIELIAYLLAEFDGSERIATEIRQAMLRAVGGLPFDHPVPDIIDRIAGDLAVEAFAVDHGSGGEMNRAYCLAIAAQS